MFKRLSPALPPLQSSQISDRSFFGALRWPEMWSGDKENLYIKKTISVYTSIPRSSYPRSRDKGCRLAKITWKAESGVRGRRDGWLDKRGGGHVLCVSKQMATLGKRVFCEQHFTVWRFLESFDSTVWKGLSNLKRCAYRCKRQR